MYGRYGVAFDGRGATAFGNPTASRACIRKGSTGSDVYFLRVALYDGHGIGTSPYVMSSTNQEVFDSGLKTAVESFQTAQGIGVDGVAGPNTWKALGETGAACSSSRRSPSSTGSQGTGLAPTGPSAFGPFYKQKWFYWTVGGVALAGAIALFMLPKKKKGKRS